MNLFRAALLGFLVALVASCGIIHETPGPEARAAASSLAAQAGAPDDASQFALFARVFEQVRIFYVDPVDDAALLTAAADGMRKSFADPSQTGEKKLVNAAIDGMLGSLDPYSAYLDSNGYRSLRNQTRGQFGGIGLKVTREDDEIKVISPIDDTPAAAAGIQSGDTITHADGQSLLGLTLRAAVRRLRGPAGSPILLTVRRAGSAPFDVAIVRAVIQIKSVRWSLEDDIGYIRISSFTSKATTEFQKAVRAIRSKAGPALVGFVIDLRNNPGGLLDQSVLISDALLERGEIVSTRGRTRQKHYNAHAGDITGGLPLVVLVNGGSASAAEIVAGALKDHRRAVLVGARTFGKGSVQITIPLGQNDALKLTSERYYTPAGNSVEGGIQPDIAVAQDADREGDEQRERATAELSRIAGR